MRLTTRLRGDERGSALVLAVMATALLLALGLALLSIVDTQATESTGERTRERGFNLSESLLNSQAFVLGRNWPSTAPSPNNTCGSTYFGDTVGSTTNAAGATAAQIASTALLRPNINASYTDSAYSGATWKVYVCDDDGTSTVWSNSLLTTRHGYDENANNLVWVRAQATLGTKTRAVAGLVRARTFHPLNSKYGLVAGNLSEDLSSSTNAVTTSGVVTKVTSGLLNSNPAVAADVLYPAPASGVTGVRCGLLDHVSAVKTCVTGAISATSGLPVFDALVTSGKYEQFAYTSSTSADAIAQLRTQAKTSPGKYMATASGATPTSSTDYTNIPSCAISGATSSSVVFIEKVGNGDQYCYIDVSAGVTYKALVIGSGRVVIRGSNTITSYFNADGSVNPANLFTGVIYALNNQTSDLTSSAPLKELIRIEKAARVRGAVHADGKNATVGIIAPDFNSNALITGLFCPGALCGSASTVAALLSTLGVSAVLDQIVSGCVGLVALGACVGVNTSALGINSTTIAAGITAQMTTYGSAIHSDVATINSLSVYGTSGVVSGTFRDLQQR
jgi:hypothetical protein